MPIQSFKIGEVYSRQQISNVLGGDWQSYLPHRDGKVVCGCFDYVMNPDAPHTIVFGEGEEVEKWAKGLFDSHESIPVFMRKGNKQ